MENNILNLLIPVMVNGKEIKKFKYDIDEITAEMFCEAAAEAAKMVAGKGTATVMEVDNILHLNLGMQAIIAVNPVVDRNDLMRMKGMDVVNVTRIGRNFITWSAAESLEEEICEEQFEVTPESTTLEPND